MATGESPPKDGNGVQFRDTKPTKAELRESSQNAAPDSSARDSHISQGSQSGKGGVLMIRKFNMTDELKNYTCKEALYVSIVQIIVGIVCMVVGIVAVVLECAGYESAVGIWGGVIVIVTGVVGVLAYKRRIARLVVSCFAMALISMVIGGTIMIMLAVFLSADINRQKRYTEEIDFWPPGSSKAISSKILADGQPPKIAVDAVLLVVGVVEMVVAIIQAVIGGKVLIIRGPRRKAAEAGAAATPLTDVAGGGADDGWGEYIPAPRPQLTRTVSETEAEQEWDVDPSRAPTKRSSYRGPKSGGYSPVKQPSAEGDNTDQTHVSGDVEVAATVDADVQIGFSAGAGVDAEANVKY
jgi:hypothetical protein